MRTSSEIMGECDFKHELELLLIQCGYDTDLNSPSWILADYVQDCLDALKMAQRRKP